MMRKSVGAMSVVIGLMMGCGQPTPPGGAVDGGGGVISTPLVGVLPPSLRGQTHRVDVYDYLGGTRGPLRCQTEADRDGKWSCDLQALYGDFIVEADKGSGSPLQAFVTKVEQGKERAVVVSPFTHLTAAYTQALQEGDLAFEPALEKARRLMQGHFGGVAHHLVGPADSRETLAGVLSESLVSGFLWVGLEALAGEIAEDNGQSGTGSINVWTLFGALAADVRADGVFDGQGPQGGLRLGQTDLDGDTLRADYGRALLNWAASEDNETPFASADFEGLAQRISANTSELFPEDVPDPLDATAPVFGRIEVSKDPTVPLATGTPVGGDFFVTVEAMDPSGLTGWTLTTQGAPMVVGQGEALGRTGYRWPVTSTGLEDGPTVFRVGVADTAGNQAETMLTVIVDNTPPVLTASAAGLSQTPTVAVSGEVTDAAGPVVRVSVTVSGQSEVVIDRPERQWSTTVNVPCDGSDYAVEVRAEDAAGNQASVLTETYCDSSAPALLMRGTEFLGGDQFTAEPSADGLSVRYLPVAMPRPTVLSHAGPHTFVKYFTRLDASSPELPVLGVTASDDRGESQLVVEYRYLVDGRLVRGWGAAETTDRFDWSVPVSYQTLGTELATAGPTAAHVVQVRARDAAGNTSQVSFSFSMTLKSPPVWVGECAVDPTLQGYTLSARSLNEVYDGTLASTPVTGARVHFAGPAPGSMASRAGVYVRPVATDVRTHINAVRIDGHPWFELEEQLNGGTTWGVDFLCASLSGERRYRVRINGVDYPCQTGAFDFVAGMSWRLRAVDGPINEDLPHSVSVSVTRQGMPIGIDPQRGYLVQADQQHSVQQVLENPRLTVAGQQYDWSETLSLPAGFVSNGAVARYRNFPAYRGQGANTHRFASGVVGRRFIMRPYISEVEVEAQPIQWVTTHAELDVEVPVVMTPQCETALRYTTSL